MDLFGFNLDRPETYPDSDEEEKVGAKRHAEDERGVTKRAKVSDGQGIVYKPPTSVYHITDDSDSVRYLGILDVLEYGQAVAEAEPDTPVLSFATAPPPAPAAVCSSRFTYDAVITPLSYQELSTRPHIPPSECTELHRVAHEVLGILKASYKPAEDRFEYASPPAARVPLIKKMLELTVKQLSDNQAYHLRLAPDTYVVGDLHGSYKDLNSILSEVLPFGEVTLCPERILCLGDYVDRGRHGVECFLRLLALKAMAPKTVYLLRGNHEDPEVCGDIATYGDESLLGQCLAYGEAEGTAVFQLFCDIFTYLPLCATIDDRVFCTHGGVPRFWGTPNPQSDTRLLPFLSPQQYTPFPSLFGAKVEAVLRTQDTKEKETEAQRNWLLTFDLLWSDPVKSDSEELDAYGFGKSPRDPTVASFSEAAVCTFLDNHNYDILLRGHEEKTAGLRVSQNSRVVTVFSCSNYQGHENAAGVVFVRKEGDVQLLMITEQDSG